MAISRDTIEIGDYAWAYSSRGGVWQGSIVDINTVTGTVDIENDGRFETVPTNWLIEVDKQ